MQVLRYKDVRAAHIHHQGHAYARVALQVIILQLLHQVALPAHQGVIPPLPDRNPAPCAVSIRFQLHFKKDFFVKFLAYLQSQEHIVTMRPLHLVPTALVVDIQEAALLHARSA